MRRRSATVSAFSDTHRGAPTLASLPVHELVATSVSLCVCRLIPVYVDNTSGRAPHAIEQQAAAAMHVCSP
jgi:hypothetical protein